MEASLSEFRLTLCCNVMKMVLEMNLTMFTLVKRKRWKKKLWILLRDFFLHNY